jgi:hypothetical protein
MRRSTQIIAGVLILIALAAALRGPLNPHALR